MTLPDLSVSKEAQAHVTAAFESWTGNPRDVALAMLIGGHAMMLALDGRTDHITLYEAAARLLVEASTAEKH